MWDLIKPIIKTVAPWLGGAIGGPFGKMAGHLIAKAITGNEDADPAVVMQALETDPEALLKLKTLEEKFKVQMKKLGVKEAQLHAKDRASARDREVQIAKAGKVEWIMPTLAILNTSAFYGLLAALLFIQIPPTAMDTVKDILFLLGGYFGGILTYYFGSSEGSRRKDKVS